jgi:hypothetical protein
MELLWGEWTERQTVLTSESVKEAQKAELMDSPTDEQKE